MVFPRPCEGETISSACYFGTLAVAGRGNLGGRWRRWGPAAAQPGWPAPPERQRSPFAPEAIQSRIACLSRGQGVGFARRYSAGGEALPPGYFMVSRQAIGDRWPGAGEANSCRPGCLFTIRPHRWNRSWREDPPESSCRGDNSWRRVERGACAVGKTPGAGHSARPPVRQKLTCEARGGTADPVAVWARRVERSYPGGRAAPGSRKPGTQASSSSRMKVRPGRRWPARQGGV